MYTPKPYDEGYLDEQGGHRIFYAQYGNPEGLAIVSLHGGPGSSSKTKHAKLFDLEKYRVILFDQRGCGKSEPKGEIANNTTQDLTDDIERLREKLGVEKWFVTGGSWGSTLALAYAEAYPEQVKGLMISAIFLGDSFSLEWFGGENGAAVLFGDLWDHRMELFNKYKTNHKDAAKDLYEKLLNASKEEQKEITADVLSWESNLFTSTQDVKFLDSSDVDEEDVTYAKVFMHYESNNMFLEDEQLLKNISKIKKIPMIIFHGRYDVLCPFKRAWDLHKAHGNSQIVVLPQSNHMFTADGEVARKYAFESFLRGF